jgi:hypothetical protein
MQIDTYFGFFAESVFTAMAGAIASQTGKPVRLEEVSLATTNTVKLRSGAVDSVIIPSFAEPVEVNFALALSAPDTAALSALGGPRRPLHRLMEQAVSTAVEPFNFVNKSRNRLTGLRFSRNVTGLTAHHLDGQVAYTMAVGRFASGGGQDFSLRLLVSERGRDLIEERAIQPHTQRALFSINEGAYVPSPQWEPPPPPAAVEAGEGLSESLMNAWMQSFFALNDGTVPAKLFKRPAAQFSDVIDQETLERELDGEEDIAVVRLLINGQKELELIVLLPQQAQKSLMSLSKSGQEKFLGDFFRIYYGEAAELWARFADSKMSWRVQGVGKLPEGALQAVTSRLSGGGLIACQEARFDDGRVRWFLAVPPHTWQFLLHLMARAVSLEAEEVLDPGTVFAATGWGDAAMPWGKLVDYAGERDLQDTVRQFIQLKFDETHMATVAAVLDENGRERWLAALPVMLRERTEACELEEGVAEYAGRQLTDALIFLNRSRKLPRGKLSDWVTLYTEFTYARRRMMIARLLPLRHLIYGMDRSSLGRLLFDMKNDVLVNLVAGAEFPVIDQMRRAISPGFAVRLLEDGGVRRLKATAYMVQEAQLSLYRTCGKGTDEGRYMLRATPAQRLGELIRWLDGAG